MHLRVLRTFAPLAVVALIGVISLQAMARSGGTAGHEVGMKQAAAPAYEVDPEWPRPLPNDWILGQVAGVAVDSRDHVWIVQRPLTLTAREAGAVQEPPLSDCCVPAPSVIAFDREGTVVRAWGGPDSVQTDGDGDIIRAWHRGERWPQSEHGIFVDHEDNVWIASNGALDHVVLKFDPDGRRLLTIGMWEVSRGSNDPAHLGAPADIAVDPETNEVYIADGYRNRRIVVFDARTGAYHRHWGAYGERPDDGPIPPYDPDAEPARSFRSPMHAVRIASDGLVYAADRVSNRIQVFRKDGTFVREAFVAPRTRAMGSIWDLELSPDPEQRWVFVPDGTNMKVWILERATLRVAGAFGRGGRYAGQFEWAHNAAIDSDWNLYVTEVNTGKRIQKFVRRGDSEAAGRGATGDRAARDGAAGAGFYSAEQADRGRAAFGQACAACHSATEFRGADFEWRWRRRTAWDLYERLTATMPEDAPGSLSERTYADVVAYILRLNDYAAGATELLPAESALAAVPLGPGAGRTARSGGGP